MMITLVTLLHVLVFVYWLGGDLGAFYLSHTVTNPDEPAQNRLLAIRLLNNLDLAPRFSLLLAAPTGITLAAVSGWLNISMLGITMIWLIALAWIGLVYYLHHVQGKPGSEVWQHFDTGLRGLFVLTLVGYPLLVDNTPLFLQIKFGLLAAAILLGLYIRRCLKPLGAGLAELTAGNTEQANRLIRGSVGRCRIPVMGIWLVITTAAFVGVLRPL